LKGNIVARPPEKLLIVSHVIHYQHQGQLYAYGPYTREIDIWADLFPQVLIASPCRYEPPPGDAIPFTRANISMVPQPETGGETRQAKLIQVALLPLLLLTLARAMWRADAIHVRGPGNLGLLGVLLAPLFSPYRVAKYANQWNGYPNEPVTVRLQRDLLRSRWWGAPVTVYGEWPHQPPHVVPFFTSMMTDEQVQRAISVAHSKTLDTPLRVLYTGRLETVKRVPVLLDALALAFERGVELDVVILGDGSERKRLEEQAAQLGIKDKIRFIGALPYDQALAWYEWGHCLVLPSKRSEGWPKVVAEAMCYGLVCIAVRQGQVPAMLTDRGILLDSGTAEEIAAALECIAQNPAQYQSMMRDASTWARRYSLEGLRDALRDLLSTRWQTPLAR
jgi:glycosyltransferase involved in cell wall biosynthesis